MPEGQRRSSDVEPVPHFLAGLEIGDALGLDVDRFAGPRITADAAVAGARGEGAEAAQFNPAAFGQSLGNGIEYARDDLLDLARGKPGLILMHQSDKLGPDHCVRPSIAPRMLPASCPQEVATRALNPYAVQLNVDQSASGTGPVIHRPGPFVPS